ncbi:pyridoxamine 5'-phosphate oxidase family protein [Novispirillum itersonii subsp. nipponicum]
MPESLLSPAGYPPETLVTSEEALQALYGTPVQAATVKELDRLTPEYRRLIEASPFVALATSGPGGLDCSPRGDAGQVVFVEDERTLLLPDRRGNNRIDSLRNVIHTPAIGLLFLIPGSGTTLRVNGQAAVCIDPALLARFAVEGKEPRSVLVIRIETVFFQCARAVVRSALWDEASRVDPATLPTPGQILTVTSRMAAQAVIDGDAYDRAWPERAQATLW